jgi:hypothetical protein
MSAEHSPAAQPGKRTAGLYNKFRVERTDGKSAPGQKHDGCEYFVLDLDHDVFAIPALDAYADACEGEYPALAKDLRRVGIMHRAGEALNRVCDDPRSLPRRSLAAQVPAQGEWTEQDQRLSEIRARLDAATWGPWNAVDLRHQKNGQVRIFAERRGDFGHIANVLASNDRCATNAALIANAPSDLAFALDVIARQRSEVKRLRAMAYAACGVCGGKPLASGKPCICGGGGTEQAEMHGLRSALFDAEAELSRLREERDAARKELIGAQCGYCRKGMPVKRCDNHLNFGPPIVWTHNEPHGPYLGECQASAIHEYLHKESANAR